MKEAHFTAMQVTEILLMFISGSDTAQIASAMGAPEYQIYNLCFGRKSEAAEILNNQFNKRAA